MRILRFPAFLLLANSLVLLSAVAQSAATSPTQNSGPTQSQNTSQAAQSEQAPQSKPLRTGIFDSGTRASLISPATQSRYGHDFLAQQIPMFQTEQPGQNPFILRGSPRVYAMDDPKRDFDKGILVRDMGGACGSIVSYNFSPGENPKLESVTTCTPSNTIVPRRAKTRKQQQPPQLQLVPIGLPPSAR